MSPGALSYALAGGAFLLLTLLLWIGWPLLERARARRAHGRG